MSKMSVGILIFDDVEVLDFAGPFEVFSRTRTIPGGVSRRSDEHARLTFSRWPKPRPPWRPPGACR